MKKNLVMIFQGAAVFIGTIVGAGLASGQEITQFFTTYGYKSFIGILICCILYILVCSIMVEVSTKFNLNSYNQLINLVSPSYLGKATDLITGFFLISSAAIILAGSGALLHQYFALPKWVGILIMFLVSLITLMKDTEGLITINSLIVPSLTITIISLFTLYIVFFGDMVSLHKIKNIPPCKNLIIPFQWLISSFLYGGFNILCCSSVLVPLSKEFKNKRALIWGIVLGSIGLTILCMMINVMLGLNIPSIFKYDIPLLYISKPFGILIQVLLLCVIWCEMFSTEVSDIYGVAKTLEQKFNLPYKKGIILVLILALPISQVGFKNLIKYLYPGFGAVSLIFIIQLVHFYKKNF